jgi:hypothetical protein
LPPHVPVQYVTPWEADDLSPYEPESPWEQHASPNAAVHAHENLEMLHILMERKSQHSLRYGTPVAHRAVQGGNKPSPPD